MQTLVIADTILFKTYKLTKLLIRMWCANSVAVDSQASKLLPYSSDDDNDEDDVL